MLRTLQKHGRPAPIRNRTAEWLDTQPAREETIYAHEFPDTPLRYLHVQVTDSLATEPDEFTIPLEPVGFWPRLAARIGWRMKPKRVSRGVLMQSDTATLLWGTGPKQVKLYTAYPYAAEGSIAAVILDEIQPWGNHVEGTLVGTASNGQTIAFFDTKFWLNAEHYQVGEAYVFMLAAIAYNLECCNGETVEMSNQEALANYYRFRNEDPPRDAAGLLPPATLSTQDLTALLPGSVPGYPEDMRGRCRIQSVSTFHVESTLVYRITPVPGEDQHPMPVIYAAEHVLSDGYQPKAGDSIGGGLWMQGFLHQPREWTSI
ncbi:MAG: hypothetical protein ABMA26_05340 [Limisphaerales bacterium]